MAGRRIAKGTQTPLLPPQVRGVLVRRITEFAGMAMIAAGFLTVIALATFDRRDPSWNAAVALTEPVRNVLGHPGAHVSDLLLQMFGAGAYVFVGLVIAMGVRTASHRRPGNWPFRLLVLIAGTLTGSIALAGWPAGEGWVLHHPHMGGVVGHILMVHAEAFDYGPIGVVSEAMIAAAALYATAFLALLTVGFSHKDVAILWRWPIWLARNLRPLAGRGREAVGTGIAMGGVHLGEAVRRTGEAFRRDPSFDPDPVDRQIVPAPLGEETAAPVPAPAPPPSGLLGGLRATLRPSGSRDGAKAKAGDRALRVAPVVGPAPAAAPAEPARKPAAKAPKAPAAQATLGFDAGPTGPSLPPLDLLQAPDAAGRPAAVDPDALQKNAEILEGVLGDFGVRGRIVKVSPGPVVTLYELEPAPGTKSSRVIGLADDIARSMSAVSARVAVVPGRNVIGIELPNHRREIVYLRELMEAEAYDRSTAKLPLVLGKDIGGGPQVADLARMPHLLVAGTTGSGKSVAVNTMILSLLYRLPPERCRFIMVDPKMLELSVYEGIPHLLAPVVTDPKKAVVALKWAVREMEDRYRAMSKLGVRNIEGYNTRLKEAKAKGELLTRKVQTGFDADTGKPVFEETPIDLTEIPYIVVIVDEMADLMLVAGKDIEAAIQRLAQMARAAGIHLIMATQRPSVDVITGTIKANFPTRISFQVTSKIDSRTILGEQGAEQLLGQGDMLHMAGGGRITRVHGPFVRDDEVEKVVAFLKSQGEPAYVDAVLEDEEDLDPDDGDGEGGFGGEAGGSGDQLYDQAVAVVIRDRKASTSYVQRQLRIGYNSAARLIERMEAEGVVSRPNHAGKRDVLVGGEG
ncbi:MAG: DNA translocase FtsK [Rhodospirillales bacterium]|jgi:S-DNA-T family DNA segregation ATPase FtsK/SpoIIIE